MRKNIIRVGFVAASVAAVVGLTGCSNMNQETHKNCLVQSKERLIQEGTSADKLVVTSCGVFTANDSIAGGFNSYDVYTGLQEGKRYDIRTGGYRVGFLSAFPNIIEVTPVG